MPTASATTTPFVHVRERSNSLMNIDFLAHSASVSRSRKFA